MSQQNKIPDIDQEPKNKENENQTQKLEMEENIHTPQKI